MLPKVNAMSESDGIHADVPKKKQNRLILCFDGTAGIGTYSTDTSSLNPGLWGRFKRWSGEILDEGFGTTFDQHVIAGYRFAMRYYSDGDRIFMFGFSRGAFTARFLARMIATVGLLSKGNEEMVPFAYRTYQEYEMGSGSKFKTAQEAEEYMKRFMTTFCRARTRVHFLGLFDTVNSVGYLEAPFSRKKYLPSVLGTADHVRHAVAIDERRCKFKVTLLQQDHRVGDSINEDVKEVFFPGGHGDVGGGWLAEGGKAKLEADDALQLSDIPLEWMINELAALPVKHPADKIAWNEHKNIFLENFNRKASTAVQAPLHDILTWGNCVSPTQTFLWRIMEWLPIFKRLELVRGQWKSTVFPPNMCGRRDIPEGADFHSSVKARMLTVKDYRPTNDGILKVYEYSHEPRS